MMRSTLSAVLFLFSSPTPALEFECRVTAGSGLEMYGSSNASRPMICEVTCRFWKMDRLAEFQRCAVQMLPHMPRQKLCAWDIRNAAEVIDETGHSCHRWTKGP